MAKMNVKNIRVEQVTRFFREGSMMLGTIRSGCLGVERTVQIESDEPEDKILKMMRAGEQSCFTMGSLTAVVPTQTHLTLNGRPLNYKEGS